MTNRERTIFYIGVTNNLALRVLQHKNGEGGTFTSKHKCHYLVYFEEFSEINQAISREKQLKNWHRQWKINLIKTENPEMKDLAADVSDAETSSA